jgi:hypothetical protein
LPKHLQPLSPEEKRRRKLTGGQMADEIGALQAQIDALKAEAIRRKLVRAEGAAFRIVLTPPGTQQRVDKPLLLRALGITEAQYTARFCHPVQTGWRLTCTPRRKPAVLEPNLGLAAVKRCCTAAPGMSED